jgi:hypothetical protein
MRMRERGIGNMPFIAMIVLLVVAIGLFFMKSDDASTWQMEAGKLKAANAANIETLDGARKAYGAWLEIAGLGINELQPKEEGGVTVYPTAAVIKDKVSQWMMDQAGDIATKSTAKLKSRQYQVDKANNAVRVQETGDTTSIQLFGLPFVKETVTFASFLAPLASQFAYAAKAMEDNNRLFEDEYKSYQTRTAQLQAKVNEQATQFQTDVASKSQLFDTEKTRADQMQDQVNQASAKNDEAQSRIQALVAEFTKSKRMSDIEKQALLSRIINEKSKMEIAMKEDPKDGEVLVADARQGLVFLDKGKNFKIAPNMKFRVWRVGKGNVRENVAEVEVIDVGDTSATARVTKLASQRVPVAQGMSFSSPFYDPHKKLRVHIYGNLRYYPSDLAKRRLAESGCAVADRLDDTVNVVILGEPAVDIEADAGTPEEAAAAEEKAKAQRAARIREVMETAATLGAIVVTEDVLQTFIQY